MGRLIRQYEKDLVPLMRNFGRRVAGRFGLLATKSMEKELEVVIDTQAFNQVLEIYLVSEVYGPGNEIIRNVIGRSYAQGFNFGGFQIGLGPENWVNQKQAGRIALLVEKNQQALKGIGEETAKQIRQSIAEGVLKGESIPKIQERIIERSEAIGVTRATMLARTEAMTAANTAAVDRYRAAGVDVLEWIAADDERTCTDTFEAQGYTYEGGCIGMDGRTFPIGQAPWCPGHPNCRCTLAPKVD